MQREKAPKRLMTISEFSKERAVDFHQMMIFVDYLELTKHATSEEQRYEFEVLMAVLRTAEEAKQNFHRRLKTGWLSPKQVQLREKLIAEGQGKLKETKGLIPFTGNKGADQLLNDLEHYPHAFLTACLMDRRINAERAWSIPFVLKQRLGFFDFDGLYKLCRENPERLRQVWENPTPMHTLKNGMYKNFVSAINRIATQYDGDASRIWTENPSAREIVRKFGEFEGIGPKISTMATNILLRDFKIEMTELSAIDISVDTHITRLFKRMGLVSQEATNEDIIICAKEIYPDYPGIIDLSLWQCGREFCLAGQPNCNACPYTTLCPKIV